MILAKGCDIGPAAAGLTLAKCAAVKAAGISTVWRYLGTGWQSGKGMGLTEWGWWQHVGMPMGFLWEGAANALLGGASAGTAAAKFSIAELQKLKVDPTKARVVYCVDVEAYESQVDAAFAAIGKVVGDVSLIWAYGGHAVIKGLFDAGRIGGAYQAEAWSYLNGRWPTPPVWDPRALVHQWTVHNCAGSAGGVAIDCADILAVDHGQWPRPTAAPPQPVPQPPAPSPQPPAPAPQPPAPAPATAFDKLPLLEWPAVGCWLVDEKTKCTTVHIVKLRDGKHYLADVNPSSPLPEVSPIHVLERHLQAAGLYHGQIDGFYGVGCVAGVKELQKAHHLTEDGEPGRKTWPLILAL